MESKIQWTSNQMCKWLKTSYKTKENPSSFSFKATLFQKRVSKCSNFIKTFTIDSSLEYFYLDKIDLDAISYLQK